MPQKGGRIDAAHHNGHAVRALSETLAFEKAIEVTPRRIQGRSTVARKWWVWWTWRRR